MTPAQLRILKTLPQVIEAVRAFQAEADELRGLLAPALPPSTAGSFAPGAREALAARAAPVHDWTSADDHNIAPPVLSTLRAVPSPRQAEEEAEARAAAQAELARRQAARTPEQVEADEFLATQEGTRRSLLAAILPGGTP